MESCEERLYITIDLGAVYTINSVTVWHYSGDTRRYCGQKVAISSTGDFTGEETTVYDTGSDFGDVEQDGGFVMEFPATTGRFIRHWSSKSDRNTGVHFLEVQVMGALDPECENDPCHGHGTCANGACTCSDGYAGFSCNECADGFAGFPSCAATDRAPPTPPSPSAPTCPAGYTFAHNGWWSNAYTDGAFGNSLLEGQTVEQCAARCQGEARCVAFTVYGPLGYQGNTLGHCYSKIVILSRFACCPSR